MMMQCFERCCLTYTPGNPDGFLVEAGNVGQHYRAWRYAEQPEAEPEPTATATATEAPSPTVTETSPTATPTEEPEPTTEPATNYQFVTAWVAGATKHRRSAIRQMSLSRQTATSTSPSTATTASGSSGR
ncbi:hypothetical protein BH23CHL2_BH23CHL2_01200 [soil metagenome]